MKTKIENKTKSRFSIPVFLYILSGIGTDPVGIAGSRQCDLARTFRRTRSKYSESRLLHIYSICSSIAHAVL